MSAKDTTVTDQDASFRVTVVINAIVGLVAFLVFCYLRKKSPITYEPRSCLLQQHPPRPLPRGFLSWVIPLIKISDDEFFEQAGLDALIYVNYFRFGFFLFALLALYSVPILIPVNYTGENEMELELQKLSMSNVKDKSSRLWAHLFSLYITVGIALWLLRNLYKSYIKYRIRYLSKEHVHFYTVLIRDIPLEFQNPQTLKAKFNSMYDDVLFVHIAQDVTDLSDALKERDQVILKLEAAVATINLKKEEDPRPQARDGGLIFCGGKKVDAEEYFRGKLREANEKVRILQSDAMKNPRYKSSGFVTFGSLQSATTAMQIEHVGRVLEFQTEPASESKDVLWGNMNMSYWERYSQRAIIGVATGALVVFYMIPISFVAALTTLEALSARLPFLEPIVNSNAAVKGFLQGFLPTLALLIFMAILPLIMTALSSLEGWPSKSQVVISATRKLFVFYLVNVFIVLLLSGSFFNQIDLLSADVGSLANLIDEAILIGEAIPATAIFFTSYVMLQALTVFPLILLRIGPLIVGYIKRRWLCKTPRDFRLADHPGPLAFLPLIPVQLLVLILGATYATVAPIIVPFCIIYFAAGYLTFKYQLFYVYIPEFETGGQLWDVIFRRSITGLIVGEVAVFAILLLKGAIAQAVLCVPLFIITGVFTSHMNKVYSGVGRFMPREEACETEKGRRAQKEREKQTRTSVSSSTQVKLDDQKSGDMTSVPLGDRSTDEQVELCVVDTSLVVDEVEEKDPNADVFKPPQLTAPLDLEPEPFSSRVAPRVLTFHNPAQTTEV